MKLKALTIAALMLGTNMALAQVAPVGKTDAAGQQAMLQSADPKLAANKKLVFDFWREVLEARHVELAEKYMTETYIQHNPNIPTGRAAFQTAFSRMQPQEIKPTIARPLISVTAEGDLVTLAFANELTDPADPSKKYTTTWFDMFRIENGKIAEHWDSALKNPPRQ